MLANELRQKQYPVSYEPDETDVTTFLTVDRVREAFWERLQFADVLSVQWGDAPGVIVAVAGFDIDTTKWAVDTVKFTLGEREALAAVAKKVRPLLFPVLDAMA